MKRLAARTALIVALLLAAGRAAADDQPLSIYGGSARPIADGATAVRMTDEAVYMILDQYGYAVDARFDFDNPGPSTSLVVGFPEAVQHYPYDHSYVGDKIENFESWVDGEKRDIRVVPELTRPYAVPDGDPYMEMRWHAKEVAFPSGRRTVVRVRYDAHYVDPHDLPRKAYYIFGTGRSWSGTIGRALFVIEVSSGGGYLDSVRFRPSGGADERARLGDDVYAFSLRDVKPHPEARLDVDLRNESPWERNGLADCVGYAEYDDETGADCKNPVYARWRWTREPLREADFAWLTRGDLRRFRAAFAAGHGGRFADPELASLFKGHPWYQPRGDGRATEMSRVETANLAALAAYEKKLARELADSAALARFLDGEDAFGALRRLERERARYDAVKAAERAARRAEIRAHRDPSVKASTEPAAAR